MQNKFQHIYLHCWGWFLINFRWIIWSWILQILYFTVKISNEPNKNKNKKNERVKINVLFPIYCCIAYVLSFDYPFFLFKMEAEQWSIRKNLKCIRFTRIFVRIYKWIFRLMYFSAILCMLRYNILPKIRFKTSRLCFFHSFLKQNILIR